MSGYAAAAATAATPPTPSANTHADTKKRRRARAGCGRVCGSPKGFSFAKACDRWRGQPSHSELNNVNERDRNFTHRFKELGGTSGKRDSTPRRHRRLEKAMTGHERRPDRAPLTPIVPLNDLAKGDQAIAR